MFPNDLYVQTHIKRDTGLFFLNIRINTEFKTEPNLLFTFIMKHSFVILTFLLKLTFFKHVLGSYFLLILALF